MLAGMNRQLRRAQAKLDEKADRDRQKKKQARKEKVNAIRDRRKQRRLTGAKPEAPKEPVPLSSLTPEERKAAFEAFVADAEPPPPPPPPPQAPPPAGGRTQATESTVVRSRWFEQWRLRKQQRRETEQRDEADGEIDAQEDFAGDPGE